MQNKKELLHIVEDLQADFAAFAEWAASQESWEAKDGVIIHCNETGALYGKPSVVAERIRVGLERLREEL